MRDDESIPSYKVRPLGISKCSFYNLKLIMKFCCSFNVTNTNHFLFFRMYEKINSSLKQKLLLVANIPFQSYETNALGSL